MPKRDGCYICGYGGYTEEHHIFGGTANRSRSERYGLKVQLCVEHHRGTNGAHGKMVSGYKITFMKKVKPGSKRFGSRKVRSTQEQDL